MTILTDDKERGFLLELSALTKRHGIAVAGCGCCGSPRLEPADASDERAGYAMSAEGDGLQWIAPSDEFMWGRHSGEIVR